jgi:RNA polymerase sigma-70 factor (ECF subfamily)
MTRKMAEARGRLVRAVSDVVVTQSPESFDDFYRREYAAVVGLAYALSGNRWIAEDLAQDAFLAAHRGWERISAFDQPGAWVRRVVSNLAVPAFRRRVAEGKAIARLVLRQTPAVGELSADDADFWRAVRSLPRRQSQVIALFYLDDRPIADVAQILDMAPGTVKKHLHDARQALAQLLRCEVDEP